ncbi:MAG: DUF4276 family protein, partial [Planctomycetota bacterium]|nr:DUF4276 family protein [Planctomycetota bacterium]
LPHCRAILILLDADDDCPARLGPDMLRRAVAARSDVPIGVVLAKREFESWFLAAASSIAGQCELFSDLPEVPNPEGPRNAKGWLSSNMPEYKIYKPRTEQKALARVFDIELARKNSPSFDKCYREIERLLKTVGSGTAQ